MSKRKISSWSTGPDLFEYTSGRFLFNEHLRRSERFIKFNVDALADAVCKSVKRPVFDLVSITKLAEGGYNRILEAKFCDGYSVIAKIPYRITVPNYYVVASEAATLKFLRSHGIAVPKVLGYSPERTNAVGTEYLLLEKLEGTPVSDQWFTMDTKTCVKVMRQIVDFEKKLLNISLPASGNLYYKNDLKGSEPSVPVPSDMEDQIVVGPTAQLEWWYRERKLLNHVDRGPWISFRSTFQAPAKREIIYCEAYGKPRLHVERYLRELHNFQNRLPSEYVKRLSEYLELSPYLDVQAGHRFSRPVIRHPDLSPSNILINPSTSEITGIVDWQYAVALPLCLCAGIPQHFQNWGDPLSETLSKPEVKLPENFEHLDPQEQVAVKEQMRRRLVHFYYAALSLRHIPDHFDALRNENTMLRAKLFSLAGAPWEGDSVSLKYAITQAKENWPMALPGSDDADAPVREFPIHYSDDEIQACTAEYEQQSEKLEELEEMKEFIGIDSVGWVPDDEHLENAKSVVESVKNGMLEHSSTEAEKITVLHHFPFDDHDEDGEQLNTPRQPG